MECIFCLKENNAVSIEHIVSESLGNTLYKMERNRVCDACNNKFAAFEREALSSTVILMERARMGVPNKKGNAAQGTLGKIGIQGNRNLVKNIVTLSGLPEKEVADWDPKEKTFTLKLPTFEKNEVAVSKTLLKIGLEALFTSKKKVYLKYNFNELREFLNNSNHTEWPLVVAGKTVGDFESIPNYFYKYHLSKARCWLLFQEKNEKTLIFKFKYGGVEMMINLLNRGLDWLEEQRAPETHETIYPAHYRKKVVNYNKKKAEMENNI